MGNRGLPYFSAKVIDKGTHALQRDAVGWRFEEIIRIELSQKAEPAPIGGSNHLAGTFCKMCPGPGRLVEDVAGFVGCPKRLVIGIRTLVQRQMFQLSHGPSPPSPGFVVGLPLALVLRRLRLSFSASRCSKRNLL